MKRVQQAWKEGPARWTERERFALKRLLRFQGLVQSILCIFLRLSPCSLCILLNIYIPFLVLFQVCAAAVHSVLYPRSDDDYSLRSDLQRALPRHAVWAGPEHRECRWDPTKVQTKPSKNFLICTDFDGIHILCFYFSKNIISAHFQKYRFVGDCIWLLPTRFCTYYIQKYTSSVLFVWPSVQNVLEKNQFSTERNMVSATGISTSQVLFLLLLIWVSVIHQGWDDVK